MKFSLVIYAAPYSTEAAGSAYRFAKAVLDEGHEIYRLFFYSDGVHNTSSLSVSAQDEFDLPEHWHELIDRYDLDSVACVSSAIKRGVINAQESERHELDGISIQPSTDIAGLGQFIDAAINSDRLVQFG